MQLLGIRFIDQILPKIAGLAMISNHFRPGVGVVDLQAFRPFDNPVKEILGTLLTDPRLITNLHIIRRRKRSAKGLRVIRDNANQQPATFVERHRRQLAVSFGPFIESRFMDRFSILDNFQIFNFLGLFLNYEDF